MVAASTSASRNGAAPADFRVQGFDPLLLISQIIALTSLHYLTLSLLSPILLHLFISKDAFLDVGLQTQGGSYNVAMVMDWRNMAGYLGEVQELYRVDAMMDKDLVESGVKALSWVLCATWVGVSLLELVAFCPYVYAQC